MNFVGRKFETSSLQPNSIIVKKILLSSQLFFLLIGLLFSCKHMPEELIEDPFIGGPPTSSIVCDEDSIYFQQQILPLFASSCAINECHDQASHEDDVILDSYSNIISTGDIEGGNPNAGDIMEVITENDPDDVMPPDPYPPLSGDEIQMIEDWILQGALQNSCDALLCDTSVKGVTREVMRGVIYYSTTTLIFSPLVNREVYGDRSIGAITSKICLRILLNLQTAKFECLKFG
jgi:hypothetical protein